MKHKYRLYGWRASHFTAKLRAYMNFKSLDYEEKQCSLYDLVSRLPKKTGTSSMPAVETEEGIWLSDTPEIIAWLESKHKTNPVLPTTPKQKIGAMLLENWIDDTWLKISIHTRWSYPVNFEKKLQSETGKALLPFAPRSMQRWVSKKLFADRIISYLPSQGVIPEQIELLENWANRLLDILNEHFKQHAYLFGQHPSIADYALIGGIGGHLNYDPWPKEHWMAPRIYLSDWANRTHSGKAVNSGFLNNDEIPVSLYPLFDIVANEYFPIIESTVESVRHHISNASLTTGAKLPRVMDSITYPMLDQTFSSAPFTYSLWRMQRLKNTYESFESTEKEAVDRWFYKLGLKPLSTLDFGPCLKRNGLGVELAE